MLAPPAHVLRDQDRQTAQRNLRVVGDDRGTIPEAAREIFDLEVTSCMMLLGQESIRDVILFPQLKPK